MGLAARALLAPIRFYQRAVSPALPPTCRFYPTCSEYAVVAIQHHGVLKGAALLVVRLLKCGPWHPGGIDLVPARRPKSGDTADPDADAVPRDIDLSRATPSTSPHPSALAATAVGES